MCPPAGRDLRQATSPKLCHRQPVLLESFCRKQSACWRIWRVRWLVLTPNALLSFRYKRGYARGHRPTERFALQTCGTVRGVDQIDGASPSCTCTSETYQAAWLLLAAAERPVVLDFVLPDSMLPSEELRWLRNTWATEIVNARCLLQTSNRIYSAPGLHAFEPSNVRFEERYCSGKVIGTGAFSTVHAARCLQTGRMVAVKRVAKLRLSSREAKRHGQSAVGSATAHHYLCLLVLTLQAPDYATHAERAAEPASAQREVVVQPRGTAKVAESAACTHNRQSGCTRR